MLDDFCGLNPNPSDDIQDKIDSLADVDMSGFDTGVVESILEKEKRNN